MSDETDIYRDLTRLATLDVAPSPLIDWLMVTHGNHTQESWAAVRGRTPAGIRRNVEKAEAVAEQVVMFGEVEGDGEVTTTVEDYGNP